MRSLYSIIYKSFAFPEVPLNGFFIRPFADKGEDGMTPTHIFFSHIRSLALALSLVFLGALTIPACRQDVADRSLRTPPSGAVQAPDSFLVVFETSKGVFTVKAHRQWSPLGVDRFYELAEAGLHNGVPVFRVQPGKLVQFGLTGDSAVDARWEARGIPDEPVIEKNLRGRMSYARSGPATRSAQLFINLRDNSPRYDTINAQGVIGYPPIAEVVAGLNVLDSLEGKYGNAPSELQDSISIRGIRWLDERFPGLDRITRVRVQK
jgi:peptidyl-prolyl cis-trans isomerase A (cyclophilin A)